MGQLWADFLDGSSRGLSRVAMSYELAGSYGESNGEYRSMIRETRPRNSFSNRVGFVSGVLLPFALGAAVAIGARIAAIQDYGEEREYSQTASR